MAVEPVAIVRDVVDRPADSGNKPCDPFHLAPHGALQCFTHFPDQLDDLTIAPWQHLGEPLTRQFLDLVEPVGARLVARIDATAGPKWMPAARDRPGMKI